MQLNATLDVDLIALQRDDELSVLLELTAPDASQAPRAPHALQIALDRSGSMAGERLEVAKQALITLIGRLDPTDALGVVAFDDEVSLAIPAGPLTDKSAAIAAVRALQPGGMTNLSGGYLRALQEARRVAGDHGATLLLLSDGHANRGIVDHGGLQALAAAGRRAGVSTSTVGLGLDYDERLLAALSVGGAGASHFALDADAAGAAVAQEVDHLLEQTAQAVSLIIRPSEVIAGLTLWNELPASGVPDGVMVELGDFHAGEHRRLLFSFAVPGMPALGPATICELELRWVDLTTMTEQLATVPVNVNVVPGDVAAGRVPDMTVREELAFLRIQRAKREAAEHLSDGDVAAGAPLLRDAARIAEASGLPELDGEAIGLRWLADQAEGADVRLAAKAARADWHRKTHRRGR